MDIYIYIYDVSFIFSGNLLVTICCWTFCPPQKNHHQSKEPPTVVSPGPFLLSEKDPNQPPPIKNTKTGGSVQSKKNSVLLRRGKTNKTGERKTWRVHGSKKIVARSGRLSWLAAGLLFCSFVLFLLFCFFCSFLLWSNVVWSSVHPSLRGPDVWAGIS